MEHIEYNKYLDNIGKYLIASLDNIGIDKNNRKVLEIQSILSSWQSTIETLACRQIDMEGGLKVLDAFDNQVVLSNAFNYEIGRNIDKIIDIKLQHPEVKLSEALLYSDERFTIVRATYKDINGIEKEGMNIINFRPDIYKYLIENEYETDIIYSLINSDYDINYNHADIFKKVLKVGIHFKDKLALMDNNEKPNVLEYLVDKYNPLDKYDLTMKLLSLIKREKFDKIDTIAKQKDINKLTMFYRILNRVTVKEAIRLGIEEKEKYGITHTISSTDSVTLKEIFYKIVEEYIKEKK